MFGLGIRAPVQALGTHLRLVRELLEKRAVLLVGLDAMPLGERLQLAVGEAREANAELAGRR
eukprot:1128424-Prymnesium_polylepis.1